MQCIKCRKRRKTKKGVCSNCRKKELAMAPFKAVPEKEMDGVIDDLKSDLKNHE